LAWASCASVKAHGEKDRLEVGLPAAPLSLGAWQLQRASKSIPAPSLEKPTLAQQNLAPAADDATPTCRDPRLTTLTPRKRHHATSLPTLNKLQTLRFAKANAQGVCTSNRKRPAIEQPELRGTPRPAGRTRELTERDEQSRLSSRLRQARSSNNACLEDIDYGSPRWADGR